MGIKLRNQSSDAETARLLEKLSQLPKATTDDSPTPPEQRSTKWRHKSKVTAATGGRVNKTRGK
jgi:hypothetical protein